MFPGHKIKERALEDRYVLIPVSSVLCVFGSPHPCSNYKLLSDASVFKQPSFLFLLLAEGVSIERLSARVPRLISRIPRYLIACVISFIYNRSVHLLLKPIQLMLSSWLRIMVDLFIVITDDLFLSLLTAILIWKDVGHQDYLLLSFVDRSDAGGNSKRYFDKLSFSC